VWEASDPKQGVGASGCAAARFLVISYCLSIDWGRPWPDYKTTDNNGEKQGARLRTEKLKPCFRLGELYISERNAEMLSSKCGMGTLREPITTAG
jgi:hypothetical protein